MQLNEAHASLYRFGNFDLDSKNGKLYKSGVLVRLPPQPLGVLQLLVENAGELVTRDQIQRQIWGDHTFVDFDRNLNVCMAQIRAALSDDAEAPRFIRTAPKRGYTFLPPVERVSNGEPVALPASRPIRKWWMLAILILCAAGTAAYLAARRASSDVLPGRIMLAVLPFENASGPEQEPLVNGLTEELISHLGSIHSGRLGVIARSSVMRFKDTRRSLADVASELNIQYAVEGTVRRSGARVRVTARLVKVSDQGVVWTEAYEEEDSNAFRMEQDAAARITAAVTQRLFPKSAEQQAPFHAIDHDAYEAYRTGRSLQFQGARAALERSIAQFEEAIRVDPRYAEAYAALADACVSIARAGGPAKVMFPRAASAAGKALELDESSAEAHNALANVRFWFDWNWAEAEHHFTRSLATNPSYAPAHHDYAWYLVAMGRTEEGLTSLRRAIALDPLSVRVNIDAGWLLMQAHRYDQAIVQAKRALELDPGLEEANFCMKRARQYQHKEADSVLQSGGSNPYAMAVYYASAGDKTHAMESLEQAVETRSLMMPLLKVDPAFTSLHGEAGFQKLVNKIGIQ